MTHTKVEAIYAIRHKGSGEFVEANGKSCWKTKGAAANSWCADHVTSTRCDNGFWKHTKQKFSEQTEYEVVDLLGSYSYLQDVMKSANELVDKLLLKNVELEQQVEALEDRLRAALAYPMDKRR